MIWPSNARNAKYIVECVAGLFLNPLLIQASSQNIKTAKIMWLNKLIDRFFFFIVGFFYFLSVLIGISLMAFIGKVIFDVINHFYG